MRNASTLEAVAPVPQAVLLTSHARRRLVERAIDPEEVDAVLHQPFLVGASRRAGRRWLIAPSVSSRGKRRFLAVIVEVEAHALTVLTAYPTARLPAGRLVQLGSGLRRRVLAQPPPALPAPGRPADAPRLSAPAPHAALLRDARAAAAVVEPRRRIA